MIYDEAFQRCAEMIYLKQEMTDNSKSPWGNNLGFSQHEDLAPQNGLPIFVKSFITNKPENARLVFTALGCVDIWINGERIGTDELKPGWSDYKVRTLYYDYDVTQALRDGENRILAVVSNGWYSGRIAGGYYGDRDPAVMLCLTVKDADGENSVVTDESWRCKIGGQVLAADIWDGEFCDGRQDSYAAMSTPGFDVSGWGTPKVCGYFDGRVTKFVGPTVQVRDELGLKAETVTVHSGVVDNGSEFGEINVVQRKKAFPRRRGAMKK